MKDASTRVKSAELSAHRVMRFAAVWKYLAFFAALVLFFFLSGNRQITVYDEGILLTDVMRVMAGQVIHRDFYYNYGPATLYLLGGLFKMFGPSVLVERLLAIVGDSLLVLTLYAMTRRLCGRRVAAAAALLGVVWVFALGQWSLLTVVMLWATWLVLKAFQSDLSGGRAFAAGVLVGTATLFRYDMGVGLAGCHLLTVAIAVSVRRNGVRLWLASFGRSVWAYVLGVGAVLALPAWAYLRVAPLHDLLFDIVLYTAKHYRAGRGLPFPRPNLAQLQDMVVYVLIAVIAASLYAAGRSVMAARQQRAGSAKEATPQWIGLLIAFSILAAVMYMKGMIRIGAGEMTLSAMPCIVLAAVLYERKASFGVGLRRVVMGVAALFFLTAGWASLHQISSEHKFKTSTLLWLLEPGKEAPQPPFSNWCQDRNPLTRGFCYPLDDDHMETVEFVEAHTRPGDTLYVGLPQHDRIFINDNITYFATQRLPTTKWSHFDPFLQNSAPTQREMIGDLQRNRPPYVVLDSEFDTLHEPNGSSVHTGVHLLDQYIAQHYRWVKTFGEMTVLERRPDSSANDGVDSPRE